MKQTLFDPEELADYLLFRMNQRHLYACAHANGQDVPWPAYTGLMRTPTLTDDSQAFLTSVAEKAPGARQRGGYLNLTVAADHVITQFQRGLLGSRELDLGLAEGPDDVALSSDLKAHVARRLRQAMERIP